MPMDAMCMDDPPDVNCRGEIYSAADHLINPLNPGSAVRSGTPERYSF
jgi:hypothetical protein